MLPQGDTVVITYKPIINKMPHAGCGKEKNRGTRDNNGTVNGENKRHTRKAIPSLLGESPELFDPSPTTTNFLTRIFGI